MRLTVLRLLRQSLKLSQRTILRCGAQHDWAIYGQLQDFEEEPRKMSAIWAVRDSKGALLESLMGASRLEVGCKIVPNRYDAFRLQVSSSYRELFDRALGQVLERERWEIVRVK